METKYGKDLNPLVQNCVCTSFFSHSVISFKGRPDTWSYEIGTVGGTFKQYEYIFQQHKTTRLSSYNVTTRLVDLVGLCWFRQNLVEKIC